MIRKAIALAVLPLLIVLVAACEPSTEPQAVITPQQWGTKVSYYDGELRVTGKGVFYNDVNARAASYMDIDDPNDDGNAVYGVTDFMFWKYDSVCKCNVWKSKVRPTTSEWQNRRDQQTLKTGLDGAASRARGVINVCAQMGWPIPNSCSSESYPTFDY